MKYDKLSRRFFLQGLGGSLMTLPVLPSLIPVANAEVLASDKFLVMLGSPHGGFGKIGDWLPTPVLDDSSPLLSQQTLFSTGGENNLDHIIRHARLSNLMTANPGHMGGNVDGGQSRLSFILGSFLNPYINKMNLYNGIDIGTFYSGHHRGVYSGNIAWAVNNPEARERMEHWPSLDQFLGNSSKFYKNLDSISLKSVSSSSIMSQPGDGTFLPRTTSSINRYYSALFGKYDKTLSAEEVAKRKKKEYLIDRVYEDYKRFVRGAHGPARRISSVDKERVERHIANLVDVQNKYKNVISSCGEITGPNVNVHISQEYAQGVELLIDLIVAAFTCGATRLANIEFLSSYDYDGHYVGDYHQGVAHQASSNPMMQLRHNKGFRFSGEKMIARLLKKMDEFSVNGQTGSILDNGLVTWTHECGSQTHSRHSVGLATFGGLGGYFKTGNYVDYRNLKNMGVRGNSNMALRPGIPIQRFWANIVQGFGFTRAEYERHGRSGYGDTTENPPVAPRININSGHQPYPARLMSSLSDKLPVVT